MFLSRCGWLFVSVYMYDFAQPCAAFTCTLDTWLLLSLLCITVSSFIISLSHSVYKCTCVHVYCTWLFDYTTCTCTSLLSGDSGLCVAWQLPIYNVAATAALLQIKESMYTLNLSYCQVTYISYLFGAIIRFAGILERRTNSHTNVTVCIINSVNLTCTVHISHNMYTYTYT